MFALFLALLTTTLGSAIHDASVVTKVHVSAKATTVQPKPNPTPMTAHPLAG